MKLDDKDKKLIRSIYSPPRLKHGSKLKDIYSGDYQIYQFSLARHALLAGLKAIDLKKGDSILIPSFICRDVLAPFNMMGLNILYYPVDENLKISMSIDELPKAAAIMAVHYFGLETNLDFYQEYCRKHNALLIEDNAHGFLSRAADGKLLGTSGDIGIISLRKTLPIPNGAILICQNKYKSSPSLQPVDVFSVRIKVKGLLRPLVGLFGVGLLIGMTKLKRHLRRTLTGEALPRSQVEDEHVIPSSPNPAHFERYIETMDILKETNRRRDLFELLSEISKKLSIRPLRDHLFHLEVPCTYPFWCISENLLSVGKELESNGFELSHWPALPESVKNQKNKPHFYENLYMVKFLW